MKVFEDGVMSESDGPPLDHDEWVIEQQRAQAADVRERERQARERAARAPQTRRANDGKTPNVTKGLPGAKDAPAEATEADAGGRPDESIVGGLPPAPRPEPVDDAGRGDGRAKGKK